MQGKKGKGGPETDRTMTVAEVSSYLSLSASSVYRLANELRALRVGGRWAFRAGDVEQWLLKRRTGDEPQIEPVEELGSKLRLFSHMDEKNMFLDVPDSEAGILIRNAIDRAALSLTESPEQAAKERIRASIMERESLCSTALHPEVAFPVTDLRSSSCCWHERSPCSFSGKRDSATSCTWRASSRRCSRRNPPANFTRCLLRRNKGRKPGRPGKSTTNLAGQAVRTDRTTRASTTVSPFS
jgi:excisionase family DNA binding protein